MDKQAVIERYKALLNELDEPARNVVLSAGSALVILGIRETTEDLDADVSEGVFKFYERSGNYPTTAIMEGDKESIKYVTFDKNVDLHVLDEDRGLACIDGVWVYSPSELLAQKRYLSNLQCRSEEKRKTDLSDIVALESLIKERNHTARVMA